MTKPSNAPTISEHEPHEAASAWLLFMIDHPDTTVTVAAYRKQLKAAQKAVNVAHANMMAAW